MTTAALQLPRPVPALPERLVSAAATRRMVSEYESALRLRRIAALGPNAAFHRGRASVHADVLAAIGHEPLTWGRCRELAEDFLDQARVLQAAAATPPDRVRTPDEFFDEGRLHELIPSVLRLSAGAATDYPAPAAEYAARLRLLLSEGADAETLLTEMWDDTLWG